MQDLPTLICNQLGLNPTLQLKKPIRGLDGFNTLELISALIYTDNLEDAAALLGYTTNPIKQCTKLILMPHYASRYKVYGNGGSSTSWSYCLLSSIQHKKCHLCNDILPYNKFHINTHNSNGHSSECAICRTLAEKQRKIYIRERTPSWSQKDKILLFYKQCPQGYHVDHIIPLKGKEVSGLHVIENMQYLTKEDNLKKNNTYILE